MKNDLVEVGAVNHYKPCHKLWCSEFYHCGCLHEHLKVISE